MSCIHSPKNSPLLSDWSTSGITAQDKIPISSRPTVSDFLFHCGAAFCRNLISASDFGQTSTTLPKYHRRYAANERRERGEMVRTFDTTRKCTCPPFPIIDISSVPIKVDTTDQIKVEEDLASKARAACESHGCFYFVVNCSFLMETIVQCAVEAEDQTATYSSDSKLSERLIPLLESLFHWQTISTARNQAAVSVYRGGEGGESGNAVSNTAEPKQSWEYSRCICTRKRQQHPTDSFLGQWSIAMHQISGVLASVLELPNGAIASRCNGGFSHSSSTPSSSTRCNYDLLRLFRYDPVGDNAFSLGSSEHTDWGTMTIVWQDSIGGLQIYCPKHGRYNHVVPLTPSQGNIVDSTIPLFVHIGDFLSLVKGFNNTYDDFIWPSPTHRVISPKKEARFSLVYFAYPEPQLSLAQAIESMQTLTNNNNNNQYNNHACNKSIQTDDNCTNLLKQLSLLSDQSTAATSDHTSTDTVWDSYQHIYHMPFASEVIPNKWSQVQRTTERHS